MKVYKSSKHSQRVAVSKHLCKLKLDTNKHDDLNLMFANHREEGETYILTTIEIAKAQKKDWGLKVYYKKNAKTPKKDVHFQLLEDTKVQCKNDKLIILASLRHRAVSWYHHYLQHPCHLCLKRQWDPWCTGKVCATLSGHTLNLANLAK